MEKEYKAHLHSEYAFDMDEKSRHSKDSGPLFCYIGKYEVELDIVVNIETGEKYIKSVNGVDLIHPVKA